MKLLFALIIMTSVPTWAAPSNRIEFFNRVTLNQQITPYVGVLTLNFESKLLTLVVYKDCKPLTRETVTTDPCLNYHNIISSLTTPLKISSSGEATVYSGYRDIIRPDFDGISVSIEFTDDAHPSVDAHRSVGSAAYDRHYHLENFTAF